MDGNLRTATVKIPLESAKEWFPMVGEAIEKGERLTFELLTGIHYSEEEAIYDYLVDFKESMLYVFLCSNKVSGTITIGSDDSNCLTIDEHGIRYHSGYYAASSSSIGEKIRRVREGDI
jgi:hypothetical protein